jgi:uncharacterized protein YndB with AHSA1/START domain
MSDRRVTVERVIAAPSEEIFNLLADPRRHPDLDGSGSVKQARDDAPDRLSEGAKFGMDMRIGMPYRVTNTVVEFDEGRRIAWRHFGHHVWRYELLPVDGNPDATLVRETFDYSTTPSGPLLAMLGVPARNKKGMEATLERLERLVVH